MGLKENIIIGHLIPAGTGQYRYSEVDIAGTQMPEMPPLPGTEAPLADVFQSSFAESTFSFGSDD
jgi:DNA-directed RNA polymerase subunit beta'